MMLLMTSQILSELILCDSENRNGVLRAWWIEYLGRLLSTLLPSVNFELSHCALSSITLALRDISPYRSIFLAVIFSFNIVSDNLMKKIVLKLARMCWPVGGYQEE